MAERLDMYSLATFLHYFNWELLHGSKMDLSEKFEIVMKKKIPLVAIPTSRRRTQPCLSSKLNLAINGNLSTQLEQPRKQPRGIQE
ncbi:Cytochrome P [Parasponia andersonii]|uniref:Cytochrome P n=1 Tax=Parasponia andersonii TaxID=3476 RepID=A0A2P5DDU2_PARAD|nr:Cytochrome P [Parasponia andersonii]